MSRHEPHTPRIRPLGDGRSNWRDDAACLNDGELFMLTFETEDLFVQEAAKKICKRCPVRLDCYVTHADEPFGVFGGTTAGDRKGKPRKACATCGEWFSPFRKTALYCSQRCQDQGRTERRRSA